MPFSTRNVRIAAATLLAIIFVGFAYVSSGPSFFSKKIAGAESTEDLLKAYTAKDSDSDGLPDWQEALFGTDPNKADTDGDGMSDGEAYKQGKLTPQTLSSALPKEDTKITSADLPGIDPAAGSITEQFSKEFLQEYVAQSNGQPMSVETQQALITKLMQDFSTRASKVLTSKYTLVSVHTSKNLDILTYAASVENVLQSHEVAQGAGAPLDLMQALLEAGDESARGKLSTLAASYAGIDADLLALPVPTQLAENHLALIRAYDSLAQATKMVTVYEKDPVGVLGALSIYQPEAQNIVTSLKTLATAILSSSGEPAPGAAGSLIVTFSRQTEKP